MDLLIRYNDGPGMRSSAGVVEYFGGHLQETKEAGELERCSGYLSREGRVMPEVYNPDLWREVGWDSVKQELPPPELLRQLSTGRNLERNKLTQGRGKFRQPKEALITLPSEVSQSLLDFPEIARTILRAAVAAHLAEVERKAVRIQVGGKREWQEARTLSLAYIHAENRGGDVHYHAHVLTFLPAKALDGTWRTWDNGLHMRRLSQPGGGREKVTDAMLTSARRHGLEVDLRRGVAADAPGMAQGARVWTLDGQFIEAGSLDRKRRVEILAAQELKRELGGVAPLTPRELEIVRKLTGTEAVQDLSGERRRLALVKKLNDLGMLGEDGCILPKAELAEKLRAYEEKLALAQVQLEAGASFPGTGEKYLEAASLVQAKREHVAAVAGADVGVAVDMAASTKAARIRWTEDYARVLLLVHQAGPEGLRTDSLSQRDRNLLSKLKGAGHLIGRKIHGRHIYRVSDLGISKLQELRAKRGSLVDSLLPGVHQELQLAADPGSGPGGGGRGAAGQTPGSAALSTRTAVQRESERVASLQSGAPGLEHRGPEAELDLSARGDAAGILRDGVLSEVGFESNPGAGAVRLPAPRGARVDSGAGIREDGHAIPEGEARPDHDPELAASPRRGVEGNLDPRRGLEAIPNLGTESGARGRNLHSLAGDADPGRSRRKFPILPVPVGARGSRPGPVSLGLRGRRVRSGGLGPANPRPALRGDRGLPGALGIGHAPHQGVAGRSKQLARVPEGLRVGTRSTGARDPRSIRGLRRIDVRAVQAAELVQRSGVPIAYGGQPVLVRGVGAVGRGVSLASAVGQRPGGWGLAAYAVKRSTQLALELMDPRRVLDPLWGLDLPRNFVRRGFEQVWDLGLRIGRAVGRHFGQDFRLLAQIPAALQRPVQAIKTAIQEGTKAEPKIAPKIQPKARQKVKSDRDTGWDL